uniref:Dirigent protein n=1 Tax=Dysosma pleiantha TaxID=63349 RepID=A0A1B0P7T7_9MAGN|nr:pinoresinol synthase [Dysosma pleiantha]
MGGEKAFSFIFLSFLCFFLANLSGSSAHPPRLKLKQRIPCKQLFLSFHDVFYNGHNKANATPSIVGAPQGANLEKLAGKNHFGNVVVFNNPITLNNNFHSPPVGRAQGLYVYNKKNTFHSWLIFSFTLNTTMHQGTLIFLGADPILIKNRDITVVGGTGDFFMARGIATIATDSYKQEVYFRLKVDIKLYECW